MDSLGAIDGAATSFRISPQGLDVLLFVGPPLPVLEPHDVEMESHQHS